ncbi:DUF7931 domain-containing protein [Parachitinimonas caeni]|uniref:DUF7931 domain-containing protein n=1 Tax=Parachitinimonas caeni TaxID=3031301 RepID=A0ABT7DTE2_9NEIS|nr:hypothetical protein [Parachitinimonas caeni]MDK2123349.1 hypothetical protein [Parachitinimonas caeni]
METETGLQPGPFDSETIWREALFSCLQKAQRRICLFDRDLAGCGIETLATAELMQKFLAESRYNEAHWLIHDSDYFLRRCPRLIKLLETFGHGFKIKVTAPHDQRAEDCFLFADKAYSVRRFHVDQPRGVYSENPADVAVLQQKFARMWQEATDLSGWQRLMV